MKTVRAIIASNGVFYLQMISVRSQSTQGEREAEGREGIETSYNYFNPIITLITPYLSSDGDSLKLDNNTHFHC